MENELDKMTAVEWLESIVNGMIKNGGDADLLAVIEHIQQAKQMEKEQIIDAFWDGGANFDSEKTAEQHYNEEYGGKDGE
jgi:formate dehydrogenase maturation protein FdhE